MIGLIKKSFIPYAFTFLLGLGLCATAPAQEYDPHFWCWPYTSKEALDIDTDDMKWLKKQGWYGVGVSGATHEPGGNYYFLSPTLASQSWASFEGDRITPLISAAHNHGLKFMVNMEWINPNFWTDGLKYMTPQLLKGVVTDLKHIGIDRWFDECFSMRSDLGSAIAEQCMALKLEYQEGSDGMGSGWGRTKVYP